MYIHIIIIYVYLRVLYHNIIIYEYINYPGIFYVSKKNIEFLIKNKNNHTYTVLYNKNNTT